MIFTAIVVIVVNDDGDDDYFFFYYVKDFMDEINNDDDLNMMMRYINACEKRIREIYNAKKKKTITASTHLNKKNR